MKLVELARILALGAHADQKYGGHPYSYHLQMVVSKVEELYPESPKLDLLKTVAWLHDIVEDTDMTLDKLSELGFPADVTEAVGLLSKPDNCNGIYYTEYLKEITTYSLAFKVKVADTMANLTQSTKEGSVSRVKKYSYQLNSLFELKK